MTKNVTGPDDQGRYTWTVELNPNQETFSPDIDVYFKDVLPAGMEFAGSDRGNNKINVEYQGRYQGRDIWYGQNAGFNVHVNNQVIGPVKVDDVHPDTWWDGNTPKGLSGKKIRITYYTKIPANWKQANNGQDHTFTNTAQVTNSNGTTVLKEVRSDLNYTQKYLDKKDISGSELGSNYGKATIDYQVDVNPDALTINGGNNAFLTDHIADNVELMTGTIQVIDPATGKEIDKIPKGISYDDKTRTLTIYVPDRKYVRVKYSVKPRNVSADGHTSEQFTNTAVLHGTTRWTDEEWKNHVVIDHGATLTGEGNSITLRKVSTYDLTKYLSGAEFTLYQAGVNSENALTNRDTPVGNPQTTNEEGKAVFYNLKAGTLYYWKETKAPLSYAASDDLSTKHYFTFYAANNDARTETSNRQAADAFAQAVKQRNNIEVRTISDADEWVVTNTKDSYATAVIRGSKTLRNRAMAGGEFKFKLTPLSGKDSGGHDITIPMPSNSEVSVPSAGNTVQAGKESDFQFGEIKYETPGTYTYKVEEENVANRTVEKDTHVYEVKVIVKRNSDGDLYVEDGCPEYTYYGSRNSAKFDKASFVNTQKVGDIEVSKEVNGISGDKTKRFSFTITMDKSTADVVKNAAYKAKVTSDETKVNDPDLIANFKDGTVSFNLASGQTYHLYGIPVGTKYTVEEDDVVAQGYTTTVDGKSTEKRTSDQKTVEENKISSTSFVNTKNEVGGLTISKTLNGNDVLDTDRTRAYEFTLHVGGDGDLSGAKLNDVKLLFDGNRDAIVHVNGNGSVTVSGLPLNAPYTVTEAAASKAGFTTTTYQAEGKTSSDQAFGTIQKNSSVQVTNTRNLYGGISLQKKVTGNDRFKKTWFAFRITLTGNDVPAKAEYSYTYGNKTGKITFINGVSQKQNIAEIPAKDFENKVDPNYVTLKVDKENAKEDSPVLCITGIPKGVKYQIEEADYTETYGTVTYEKTTGTVKEVTNAYKPEFVTKDNISTSNNAVVTNNRDAYGQLMITKKFAGNAAKADEAKGKSITVKLTMWDTEGNLVTGEHFGHIFDNYGSTLLTLSPSTDPDNNYSVNIEKTIPVGYKYAVEEVTGDQANYEKSKKTYVYVTVKDANGKNVTDDKGVNTKKWCELKEDGTVDPADKNMADEISKESANMISPQWHKVELTNTKYAWGGFSIEKKLAGLSNDQSFNFHIVLSDKNVNGDNYGNYGDEKTPITFKNGEADISLKANEKAYVYGLNDGVHYEVTEENIPDGFSSSPVYSNTQGIVKATVFTSDQVKNAGIYTTEGNTQVFHPEKTAQIVENELPSENKATITNVSNNSTRLIITKSLAGNDQTYKGPFEFTITLKDQNGNAYTNSANLTDGNGRNVTVDAGGHVNISLSAGDTYTLNGLPVGTNYVVKETTDEQGYASHGYEPSYEVNGVKSTDTANTASGTISNSGNIVRVTNTRNSNGALKVSKKVEGNAANKSGRWKFKLVLGDVSDGTAFTSNINLAENEADSSKNSSATDKNGTTLTTLSYNSTEGGYVFWLSDGQSLITTSNALPAGISYHVEEVKATDDDKTYSTVVSGDTGTIAAEKTNEAAFTNTRSEQYSLTLTKFVQSNTSTEETFKFTVRLYPYDQKVFNGTVNGVTFKDNVAEVSLKGGESKTLTGLPNGSYTVTEEGASDYQTTIRRSAEKTSSGKPSDLSIEDKTVKGQFDNHNLISDDTNASEAEKALNTAKDQTVTFTNSKMVYGGLEITKQVDGTGADLNARFKFVIRLSGIYGKDFKSTNCSASGAYKAAAGAEQISTLAFTPKEDKDYSESEPFYLGDKNTLEVSGLPSNAAYEVVETDNTFGGLPYEQTAASGMTGFIPEEENAVAKVTNTLVSNGQLTLKKQVTGNTDKSARFFFDLTGTKEDRSKMTGAYGDVTFNAEGKAAVDVRTDKDGNGETTLTGLPIGSTITVKERDYTGDGYDAPVYEIGGKEQKDAKEVTVQITSESKDQPISVAVRNNRELPLLRIKKTMKYPDGMTVPKDIVFHVAGDNGFSADLNYNEFTDDEQKNGKVLQVPYGTYTVTETGGSVESYHLTTTYKVDGENTQKIDVSSKEKLSNTENLTGTIEITNTYAKQGGFRLTKNVTVNDKPADSYSDDAVKTAVDGTYWFDILDANGISTGRSVQVKVQNGESNTVSVDNLNEGTYFVQENLSKSTGDNVKNMTELPMQAVSVSDGVTSADAKAENVSFTNNLEKNGSLEITKKIQVDGKIPENKAYNGSYVFLITSEDKNEDGSPVYSNAVTVKVENGKSGAAKVDDLKPGKYTVTEMEAADQAIPVSVTYSSQETEVEAEKTAKVTVTNNYTTTPAEAKVNLQVRKQVTNLADEKWPAGGFTFALTQTKGENVLQKPETAAAVSSSSPAVFAPMTFKKAGNYQFEIREVIPDGVKPDQKGVYVKDGITYSTAVHTADVEVTDDHNGKLVAEVTYDDGRKDVPTVTNTYGAGGTWTPTATKTVDGKKPNRAFGFELSAAKGNDNAKAKLPKSATASNDLNGNIVFDPIGFTLEDVGKKFEFQMEETSKDGNGIMTDKTVHDIVVTVSDNGDGTLKVVPVYRNEKSIVFNNHTTKKPQTPGTGRHNTTVKKPTQTNVSQTTKRSSTSGKVNAPDTGDHNRTAGWALVMLVCMLTALAALIVRRRNSK